MNPTECPGIPLEGTALTLKSREITDLQGMYSPNGTRWFLT